MGGAARRAEATLHGPLSASWRLSDVYPWYVAGILCLAQICSILDRYVMSLVAEPAKRSLELSDAQLGLLQGTGFVVLYSLAGVPLGWLSDRVNRRNLIIAGLLAWSAATAASAFADSFAHLFICRMAVGIAEACLLPSAISLLVAYFQRHRLATGVSIFSSGNLLGKSLAFLAGGFLLKLFAEQNGLSLGGLGHLNAWQAVFLFAALPGPVVALLLITVREPSRGPAATATAAWRVPPDVRSALRHVRTHAGAYSVIIGAHTAVAVVSYCSIAWAGSVFVRRYGLTVPAAAVIIGTVALVVGVVATVLGGIVTDGLGARRVRGAPVLVLGLIGMALAPASLVFCTTDQLTAAIVSYAAIQFLLSMAATPGYAGVQMITPDGLRGLIAAAYTSFYTLIALGLGPPVVGLLSDNLFSGPAALSHALLIIFLSASAIISATALLGRGKYQASVPA